MLRATLASLVLLVSGVLFPTLAQSACKDLSTVGVRLVPLSFSIGSALSSLSDLSNPSGLTPSELTTHMLIKDNVTLATYALYSVQVLLRLQASMKLTADATLIGETLDAMGADLIGLLDGQVKSINSLLPIVRSAAFLQQAMQARDRIIEVSWLFRTKCA